MNECITPNTVPVLISGYIKRFQNECNIYIPRIIFKLIQHFCGLIYFKENNENICKRAGHNGTILYIKNEPYLFIFGGYDGDTHLKDAHLIPLNPN